MMRDHILRRSGTVGYGLVAGALLAACSGGNGDTVADQAPPREVATGELILSDSFDDDSNGWGGPYQRFEDGYYVWNLSSGQSDVRAADTLIRVEDKLDDIVVTTTFESGGIKAVGIQCAFEELEGSSRWYDLELSVDGAVIRKRGLGDTPVEILADNPAITLTDEATELVAECIRGNDDYFLRLHVQDAAAVEAHDPDPFGRAGAPNLSVRAQPTGPDSPGHIVRFHRIEITGDSGS